MNAPATSRDPYGPSDSSDSANDRPTETADSDAAGTGERASAEPPSLQDDDVGRDIDTDQEVDADHAGISRAPADPTRNGGLPPASGRSLGGEDED